MQKYPDITDIDFYKFINKKFSEFKISNKKKTLKQICFPNKYEFQIPQKFLAEFINPKTPYKGILIYHRIGAGKTCTAINIAEKFKKQKNIMIVLPASLKGNIRSELRSLCAGENYLTNVERERLKKLHPSDVEYKEIIKHSDIRIDKYYNIYSYNKFVNLIKTNSLNLKNTLLIIDEIHNMISETGIYYETLNELMDISPIDMRLVIMSATPIFDKPTEIALMLNLLLRKNKKIPTGQDFINTFIDTIYTPKGIEYRAKNINLFKNYIRGYISYYRGAPPHVFPKIEINFVKCKMSDTQYKLYTKISRVESKNDINDYVNIDISNSFFIGTRMISNFMFPNKKIGQEGFDSLEDDDLSISQVKEYSPKFLKILRKIKKCDGTVFVYSNFKEFGGIRTFVRLLEHHHFKNYELHGNGLKRFAIWSGDQDSFIKEEIKAVFNNKNNIDGSKIKIILGSPSIKEGVSLLRIQEVHLMEPYWNWSRMDQIIGRAVRFCSHKDVVEEKRLVKVYIYLSVHPKLKMSIDQRIMRIAIKKKEISLVFENAMKEAAIDCDLFKNANEKDLICEQ
uniref:Helicase ATP-binding domain-containing protein n=1 Tax=viral metagenome TaxID=1070528 RepID=A0A6C0LUM1_9ZZZZ